MARSKSILKRIETSEKARQNNKAFRSSVRTQVKKFKLSLENDDLKVAEAHLNDAVALIDKSVTKKVMHRNTAARQKRHLQSLYNKKAN